MDSCLGSGLFGPSRHKFVARYDRIGPAGQDVVSVMNARDLTDPDGACEVANSLSTKKYVADVCVRCGAVVKRDG